MAIGLGTICGFKLPENFNDPYLAVGIQDFWRRWHITLSVWFKKYVYIPLGGNRAGRLKTYRNLFIVFLLTGIWHGANWTFLVWGLWHGGFMTIERAGFGKLLKRIPPFFSHLYTLMVVMIGWIIFRSDNLPNVLVYLKSLISSTSCAEPNILLLLNAHLVFIFIVSIGLVFRIPEKIFGGLMESSKLKSLKDVAVLVIFVIAVSYMVSNGYSPSIYTKF